MHIRNLFLLLLVKNMTVEEGNKLHNLCGSLILVTKYNNYYCLIVFKLFWDANSFLSLTLSC